ncbi:MAG: hypothetical protein ACR2KU_08170 [Gammaproteobacteria bacterium]
MKTIGQLLPLVTAYLTGCSLLYLIVFWGSFDVNVFDYITLQQALTYAGTMFMFIAFLILPLILAYYFFDSAAPEKRSRLVAMPVITKALVAVYLASAVLSIVYRESASDWLLSIWWTATAVVPVFLASHPALKDLVKSYILRIAVALVVFYTPYGAVNWGMIKADQLKNDTLCNAVEINETHGLPSVLIRVGVLGDTVFLGKLAQSRSMRLRGIY